MSTVLNKTTLLFINNWIECDSEQFTLNKPQCESAFIWIWDSVRFVNCYMESALKKEKCFVHVHLYTDIWIKISESRLGISMIHNWILYENEVKILNSLDKYKCINRCFQLEINSSHINVSYSFGNTTQSQWHLKSLRMTTTRQPL